MTYINNNITHFKSLIPNNVKLIAVSKTHPASYIEEAYKSGQQIFGENKVQEMCAKYEQLSTYDIKWHLIGHLQTNKVKYVCTFVDMIHSVDSLKLLKEINKQSKINNRITKCLFQFHISDEETKFGLSLSEAQEIINSEEFKELTNVQICGVMGMASFTDDINCIRSEFKNLKQIFKELKSQYFDKENNFCEISMGMSSDWEIAIEEGSTMIRIGSAIFGNRDYSK